MTTKNLTSTVCHAPIRNKGDGIRITNLVLSVIAAFCGMARVVYKAAFSFGELGLDDYAVLATVIAGVPSTISKHDSIIYIRQMLIV